MRLVHAGRRVREGGFLIYFELPSASVDTTDVWMVQRRARLRTSLAGPWTGPVLGGIAATVTALLPRGRVGTVLFAMTLVFAVAELVNFNPRLELVADPRPHIMSNVAEHGSRADDRAPGGSALRVSGSSTTPTRHDSAPASFPRQTR